MTTPTIGISPSRTLPPLGISTGTILQNTQTDFLLSLSHHHHHNQRESSISTNNTNSSKPPLSPPNNNLHQSSGSSSHSSNPPSPIQLPNFSSNFITCIKPQTFSQGGSDDWATEALLRLHGSTNSTPGNTPPHKSDQSDNHDHPMHFINGSQSSSPTPQSNPSNTSNSTPSNSLNFISDETVNFPPFSENSDQTGKNNNAFKRKKRGKLPGEATSTLKKWLFEHNMHPYPTEEEKLSLANSTSLSFNQINNWFTNARRRILPRQLDRKVYGSPLFSHFSISK
eukprot:gene858-1070_t